VVKTLGILGVYWLLDCSLALACPYRLLTCLVVCYEGVGSHIDVRRRYPLVKKIKIKIRVTKFLVSRGGFLVSHASRFVLFSCLFFESVTDRFGLSTMMNRVLDYAIESSGFH
jgi:hypothetical protein